MLSSNLLARGDMIDKSKEQKSTLYMILDWSRESSLLIKNVIEARRRLLLDYLYEVDVERIELGERAYSGFSERTPPLLYYNGRLVSSGKAPTPEEIVNIILDEDQQVNSNPREFELECPEKRPTFGSVAII